MGLAAWGQGRRPAGWPQEATAGGRVGPWVWPHGATGRRPPGWPGRAMGLAAWGHGQEAMGLAAPGHGGGRRGPWGWPGRGRQHIVAYAINELQLGDGFRAVCGQRPVIWPFARRSVWGPHWRPENLSSLVV